MRTRLAHFWELLASSYWFIPSLMTGGAACAALVLLQVDRRVLPEGWRPTWLYSGSAAGARAVLGIIAGSVITVAGVVFSITIAALTQASSQFGPRLLRNFIRDRSNQAVLGTFVATFLYCLLVMRVVTGDGVSDPFVPELSVTVGVLLAVASIAVLIYFIHHVSKVLQAPVVVAAVSADLRRAIRRLEPDGAGEPAHPPAGTTADPAGEPRVVCSRMDGYLQVVDHDSLVEYAERHDLFLALEHRAGHYVIEGTPIARVWPARSPGHTAPRADDAETARACREAFIMGAHRTAEQDLEFSVHQLVELAVRALSPGINDPFTAINCVDALGSALCRIARSRLPPGLLLDTAGRPRVRFPAPTFDGIAHAALTQVRQHGVRSIAVLIRMLEVIAAVGPQLRTEAQRCTLRRHADLIYGQARAVAPTDPDLADLRSRYEAAVRATTADDEACVQRQRGQS